MGREYTEIVAGGISSALRESLTSRQFQRNFAKHVTFQDFLAVHFNKNSAKIVCRRNARYA